MSTNNLVERQQLETINTKIMIDKLTIEVNSLSQNRAEEFGFDILDEFVLPPIYGNIDFQKSAKSKIFIGGRGCGKTMLLRYLCHETTFSTKKNNISESDFQNIGLYWKPETYAVHQFQKRDLELEKWKDVFEHFFTLIISIELLKSVESIANSKYSNLNLEKINSNDFISFSNFGIDFTGSISNFKIILKKELNKFQFWIKNISNLEHPSLYPISLFKEISLILMDLVPVLKNSLLNIYIDEYENLVPYQQEIVNTWVKHSEKPFVFNLAMKRNAFRNKRTVGNESLSKIHDYRIYDLEENFEKPKDFEVFASEVLLHRLFKKGLINSLGFDTDILTDISKIEYRNNPEYKKQILNITHAIFPSKSEKELANEILNDKKLFKRLENKISISLKKINSTFESSEFIYPEDLRVSIVAYSLINRKKLKLEEILKEINNLQNGLENKFFGKTNWVHNNFIGSYLLFYVNMPKFCPFYSGFGAFCLMSKGNIRHLMELCYKTFIRASENHSNQDSLTISQITIEDQAKAAKQASSAFLNEIKTFGKFGNQLHTLAIRIGYLFSRAQHQLKQSEPEKNHFSLGAGGNKALSQESIEILNESLKWSVFFENKSTKNKTKYSPEFTEYVLNPIYSSYFHISYRKKRKLELSTDDLENIIYGSLNSYENVLKKYNAKWEIEDDNDSPNLFSNLNGENDY